MKKIQYHKKEIENNLRWQFMKNAFDGIRTPDAFLIGHAFLIPELNINNELWQDFSQFCNFCDTIAYLRNQGLDRESCLSLWMSYRVGGFTQASNEATFFRQLNSLCNPAEDT